MITKLLERSRSLKRRIEHRLRPFDWEDQESPMLSATNIHYDVAGKSRAIDVGGIGNGQRLGIRGMHPAPRAVVPIAGPLGHLT